MTCRISLLDLIRLVVEVTYDAPPSCELVGQCQVMGEIAVTSGNSVTADQQNQTFVI